MKPKKKPVEYALVTPCCQKKAVLYGVADALGGVHWCPCGLAWRMRDLVRAVRARWPHHGQCVARIDRCTGVSRSRQLTAVRLL